jgi:hypothetical protein
LIPNAEGALKGRVANLLVRGSLFQKLSGIDHTYPQTTATLSWTGSRVKRILPKSAWKPFSGADNRLSEAASLAGEV